MWEKSVNIHEVKEIRTRCNIYFGVGAIARIKEIAGELATRGIHQVLVVTGRGAYKKTGAWDHVVAALDAAKIAYTLFDRVTPNPTTVQVDQAAAEGRAAGARAVIAIGGGSAIDAGKSVAILLEYPQFTAADLYEFRFTPDKAAPLVAINLTHGTGTEADRFAVATIPDKEYKPAIAYDCIYPTWSIDDPGLMTGLSDKQTRFVSIDAVNHVIEASTSLAANPYSIMLAKETIALVARYLPVALKDPQDLTARYFLLYASMIAGVSFDNGLLHYTHALEHPLSAVKPDLAHGLGLAMLLPAVVKNIYPKVPEVLAELLAPMAPGLTGRPEEALQAAVGVEKWLFACGVSEKLTDEGFSESDVDRLTDLAFETPSLGGLLAIAPTHADRAAVAEIYRNSLRPLSC